MNKEKNPLGCQPIHLLLQQFAVPSVVAMLVSALYNIIDQFFIGRSVGELGNAATNVCFPLSTACVAIALLFGIGGASTFNLSLGRNNKEDAMYYAGNSIFMLLALGTLLFLITELFMDPLLGLFGCPDDVWHYAKVYTRITALGFPFLIVATGAGNFIRADGNPRYMMICNLVGAAVNTVLDALFVFTLNWGMAGAAWATIIGQVISGLMVIYYLNHFQTAHFHKKYFSPKPRYILKSATLGTAPCINQLSMMIVQIVMNKSLTYYGALSIYGASIPLACAGIITKISMLYFSFVIGLSQGLQPIVSFNYGAQKYMRVKRGYLLTCLYGFIISVIAFIIFESFPHQITALFGNGSELYFDFAVRYFRTFLCSTIVNFCQPISANFFTAIGKPMKGIFLSLTRQIIFFLPLLVILPMKMGINGILYTGPIADFAAALISAILIIIEFRKSQYHIIPEEQTVLN